MPATSQMAYRLLSRSALPTCAALLAASLAGCGGDGGSAGSATALAAQSMPAATPTSTASSTATAAGQKSSAVAADTYTLFTLNPVSDVHPANGDDPGATSIAGHQHVIVEPTTDAHRLFVFLVGTTGDPEKADEILREAGRRGFHVISLAYPNMRSIDSYCSNDRYNPDCEGNVRRDLVIGEKADGTGGASPLVTVSRTDSILGRLDDALAYLIANRPGKGWDQFATSTAINWNMVVVGGHSQGAGHAAFLGQIRKVARVGMLSGVYDQYLTAEDESAPSAWLDDKKRSKDSCYFGFGNQQEYAELNGFDSLQKSWVALRLDTAAPVTSVDDPGNPPTTAHAPTNGARRLSTNIWRMQPGINAHVETIANPAFLPVWSYMLFNLDPC